MVTEDRPIALIKNDQRLLDKALEASTEHLYGFGKPVAPSGAMPTEEDVARALCKQDGHDPDEPVVGGQATGFQDFGPRWQAEERSENTLGGRNYVQDARAVLALFAPILAEKERKKEAAIQVAEMNATAGAFWAERGKNAEARALSAEAALAAERERCAKVAEDHGVLVSNEPIGKACSRNIAAAIRAQGE